MDNDSLFPDKIAGSGLTPADLSALARVPGEIVWEAESLLRWWRGNRPTYDAFVRRTREMLEERGAGLAALHVACEMRHPRRGVRPVTIPNAAAVLCARVAAMRERDLRAAFAVAAAPVVDALLAAGWGGTMEIHEERDLPL